MIRVFTDVLLIGGLLILGAWFKSWASTTLADPTVTLNWNTIILALIGLAQAALVAYMARMAKSTEKIHVAVNSERTTALEEIRDLKSQILALSTDKAEATEKARGIELAAAEKRQP
jgi:hypothetical protein